MDSKADRWSAAGLSYLNTAPMSRLHKAVQGPDLDLIWGCSGVGEGDRLCRALPRAHTIPGRRNMEVRTGGDMIVALPSSRSLRLREQM